MPLFLRAFACVLSLLLLAGCQALFSSSPPALVGTQWQVTELQGEPYEVAAGEPVLTLLLLPDGHISAYAGCNPLAGDYQHKGGSLRIGPQAAMHKPCEPAKMQLEKAVVRALEGASSYSYEGATLSLCNPIGIALIRFQPAGATAKAATP